MHIYSLNSIYYYFYSIKKRKISACSRYNSIYHCSVQFFPGIEDEDKYIYEAYFQDSLMIYLMSCYFCHAGIIRMNSYYPLGTSKWNFPAAPLAFENAEVKLI